jgi:hypothetical protein
MKEFIGKRRMNKSTQKGTTKRLLSVLLVVPIFFEDELLKAPKKRLSGTTMLDKP